MATITKAIERLATAPGDLHGRLFDVTAMKRMR
jgi:hypothetical protein